MALVDEDSGPVEFKYCGVLTVMNLYQHTARITTRDNANDCTILRP
jgi:hypothetical protein